MSKENAEELLFQKHKKERKDLQAQIQVLKKTVCKGDKKKKKEVTEQIANLESELDRNQEEELTNLKLSKLSVIDFPQEIVIKPSDHPEDEDDDETEERKPNMRVSKAQKRREKKENAERERNRQIQEQEELNVFGKRNMETQAIKKILGDRNLMIYEIPSDGHCLYNAIAHQLKSIDEVPVGLQDMRERTANFLRENMQDYIPFFTNPDSDELFSTDQFEKYCDNIANTSAWGGAIELQALSQLLKCPIEVIQAIGAPYIIGSEFEAGRKVILTYHRHMYELGAHYNSVAMFVKEDEDT